VREPLSFAAIRDMFPAVANISYLNTGTVAPIPTPVMERLFASTRWYMTLGPDLPEARARRKEELAAARETVARFFGVDREEVVLTTDTTQGMNVVLAGLELKEGDEVIVSDLEHYVGRVPWRYMADRKGLRIVVVEGRGGNLQLEDVEGAITPRTRVISLSHVSFLTGARLPIEEVGALARRKGIFLLVDGAQSAGVLNLNLRDLGCDAFAFPGYKWCLGPEGSAGFFLSRRAWDKVSPMTLALGGTTDFTLDGDYRLEVGAGRFAPSTPGLLENLGLAYSLQLLLDIGLERVEAQARMLTERCIAGLAGISGVHPLTPASFGERAGLVSFQLAGLQAADYARLVDELRNEWGVHLRAIRHLPALRASFHIYNDEEDVDRLLSAVRHYARAAG